MTRPRGAGAPAEERLAMADAGQRVRGIVSARARDDLAGASLLVADLVVRSFAHATGQDVQDVVRDLSLDLARAVRA